MTVKITPLTRRRFIAITAALAGVSVLPHAARANQPVATWRGVSLGAGASATIVGLDQGGAQPLFVQMQAELDRLENIFSLFRPNSALSRLNRQGRLANPPGELLQVLSLANALNTSTTGAFDPTVQPLWTVYANAVRKNTAPQPAALRAARARVGWNGVRFDADEIAFTRPGMSLTLNGIAQGYITDKITDLMRARGLRNVLVDMGEIRAIGERPNGGAWRAGLANPMGGEFAQYVALQDRALATSAPAATVLDAAGKVGHIFDPRTGQPGGVWQQVSVSAQTAAMADGLATAFCLMTGPQIAKSAGDFPSVKVERLVAQPKTAT